MSRNNFLEMARSLQKKMNEMNDNYKEMKELFENINNYLNQQSHSNDKATLILNSINKIDSEIVKFNIGGKVFATYKSTIEQKIKNPNSYDYEFYGPNLLEVLSSSSNIKLDESNAIFIDRNNHYFDYILDYLRTVSSGNEYKVPTDKTLLARLEEEAEFYKVEGLKDLINTPFIDSNILSKDQKKQLLRLCDFVQNQKFTLLYRGTSNGFSATDFHSKCDKYANTLTIIKTSNSHIFGGYTDAIWSSAGCWTTGHNSFLFSLINYDGNPFIMRCIEPQHAIYCNINYGPTFGNGHSLYIANNSNANKQSYSNLGTSYKHPRYPYGTNESKAFMAGSYNFQTDEIEVYKKEF